MHRTHVEARRQFVREDWFSNRAGPGEWGRQVWWQSLLPMEPTFAVTYIHMSKWEVPAGTWQLLSLELLHLQAKEHFFNEERYTRASGVLLVSDSLELLELFALVFCLVVSKTDVAGELINVSTTGHISGCVVSYNVKLQLRLSKH